MARNKPPSFDFFPDDFVGGTLHLHPTCIGIYIRLLCFQWSHGAIPTDQSQLIRITGASAEELAEHLPQALDKFDEGEDGMLRNSRLEAEREKKLGISASRAKAAAKRWGTSDDTTDAGDCAPGAASGTALDASGYASGDANDDAKRMPPKGKMEVGSRKKEGGSRKKEAGRGKAQGKTPENASGDANGNATQHANHDASGHATQHASGDANAPGWNLPAGWDDPEIRDLLDEFEVMRRRIKKPIRDRAATSRVFRQFDSRDHLAFALETCIANDYQGLRPDYRPPAGGTRASAPKTFAQQRAQNTQSAFDEVFGVDDDNGNHNDNDSDNDGQRGDAAIVGGSVRHLRG